MENELKHFKQNPGNAAFCYYRTNCDTKLEGSIEQQKQAAHEYAEKNGYAIVEEFEDRVVSGATLERQGFQHLLNEIEHKRPAYLILWRMDRLSRSSDDTVIIMTKLWNAGVKIATVAETLPDDEALQNIFFDIYTKMVQNYKRSRKYKKQL